MIAVCEETLRENVVEQWKNIPRPLCDSTRAVLKCVECLSRLTSDNDESLRSLNHKLEETREFCQ